MEEFKDNRERSEMKAKELFEDTKSSLMEGFRMYCKTEDRLKRDEVLAQKYWSFRRILEHNISYPEYRSEDGKSTYFKKLLSASENLRRRKAFVKNRKIKKLAKNIDAQIKSDNLLAGLITKAREYKGTLSPEVCFSNYLEEVIGSIERSYIDFLDAVWEVEAQEEALKSSIQKLELSEAEWEEGRLEIEGQVDLIISKASRNHADPSSTSFTLISGQPDERVLDSLFSCDFASSWLKLDLEELLSREIDKKIPDEELRDKVKSDPRFSVRLYTFYEFFEVYVESRKKAGRPAFEEANMPRIKLTNAAIDVYVTAIAIAKERQSKSAIMNVINDFRRKYGL